VPPESLPVAVQGGGTWAAVVSHVGFAALWHPELLLAVLLTGAAYLEVTGRLRCRFEGSSRVEPAKAAAFLSGLAVLYLAQGSPLEILSNEYLFTAHMIQTSLQMLVAAPLLLLGTPDWLLRPLRRHRGLVEAVRLLTRPATALVGFVAVFSVYLVPGVTESALQNGWLYLLQHGLSLAAGVLMWWPVLSPWSALPPLRRLLYLTAGSVAMLPASALIAFAGRPLYWTYARGPGLWGLTPLQDQQIGALVISIAMMAVYGVATLPAWIRLAETAQEPDPRAA
jgi:putative membrane protein